MTLGDREKFTAKAPEEEPKEEKKENWLGLEVTTSTQDLADEFNLQFQPGVIIQKIEPGSPAEQSGFVEGDVITKIDNEEIKNIEDYKRVVKSIKENKKKAILFFISREGETLFIAVKP